MDPNTLILEIIEEARGRAAELMPLMGVHFAVNQCPANIVPHTGVGGSCFSRDLVSIDVAPRLDLTQERVRRVIRYTASHELHHAARWRSVGYGRTLGEGMVSEGLADRFAHEMVPEPVMPWARPMDSFSRMMCRWQLPLALNSRFYSRRIWFFYGSPLRGIPRWAAYSLGYEVVGRYLEVARKKASDCHATPAAEVLRKKP